MVRILKLGYVGDHGLHTCLRRSNHRLFLSWLSLRPNNISLVGFHAIILLFHAPEACYLHRSFSQVNLCKCEQSDEILDGQAYQNPSREVLKLAKPITHSSNPDEAHESLQWMPIHRGFESSLFLRQTPGCRQPDCEAEELLRRPDKCR